MPLTLTILSAAVPAERRGLALGAWGGITGLAVAFGPLVGGAVVSGISWHWIFWLNVPIGLVLIPLVLLRLDESRGDSSRLDLPGLVLAGVGLLGIVWGLVRGNSLGWSSPEIVGAIAAGLAFLAALRRLGAAHARRRCCRCASSATAPSRSRTPRRSSSRSGCSARSSCSPSSSRRCRATRRSARACGSCPWTAMPMIVAPIAGALSDRIGGHRLMGAGLAPAGRRARVDRRRLDADDAVPRRRRSRSASRGSAWRSSSRRSRTSSSRGSASRSRARPRARTTRSASSAACSASPCSPRSSPTTAATARRRPSSTG